MFRVTTLDLNDLPISGGRVSDQEDFFGKPAFLTVSGQLEAEIFALALSDVYTFGPTFRAENSNTPRHLAEFWMVEPEVAFCDLDGLAELSEDFLKYIFGYLLENCREDMDFFNQWYDKDTISTLESIINSSFERITYTEAVDILKKSGESFEFPVEWGNDLQSEHERYITEKKLRKPVIVTDYPREIKAFYMRLNDDEKTVRAMDVLGPKDRRDHRRQPEGGASGRVAVAPETAGLGRKKLLVVSGPAQVWDSPPFGLWPGLREDRPVCDGDAEHQGRNSLPQNAQERGVLARLSDASMWRHSPILRGEEGECLFNRRSSLLPASPLRGVLFHLPPA